MMSVSRRAAFLFPCLLGIVFIGVSFYKNLAVPVNSLKIMTYNVGDIKKQPTDYNQKLIDIIKRESPDIVLLQEAYQPAAEVIAESLGYRMSSIPGEKKQHVRILSRYPLKVKAATKLNSCEGGVGQNVVCAEVKAGNGVLLVCSVYLTSVRSEIEKASWEDTMKLGMISLKEITADTSRSRGAEELVEWLHSLKYENVVIGGDFNSLFLSKAARIMRRRYKDSSWFNPSLFASSHKIQGLHMPVKVDYIFLSHNLTSSGTKVILEGPGDHYPVVTNVHQ